MADIVNWQDGSHRRAVIEHAISILAEGGLVAFPTDTTYAITANLLIPEAVERLDKLGTELTLALPTAGHALDWAPAMSPSARRIARRCWPGPIRLLFPVVADEGLSSRLPESVRNAVTRQGMLSLYVPDHEALAETLFLIDSPLALVPAGRDSAATTAAQVQERFGSEVALIVDDGPSPSDKPLSAVRINGDEWSMVSEGPVTAEQVARSLTRVILFVCTGNTCRSPMAEALCSKLLAERLKCKPEELPQRGFLILSAGLAAMSGDPAAPEAVEIMEEMGADLTSHSSRPLNAELVLQADHLITMTHGHLMALASRYARFAPQPRLLDPQGGDVADPVGADREVYRACAVQISQHLEAFLAELLLSVPT